MKLYTTAMSKITSQPEIQPEGNHQPLVYAGIWFATLCWGGAYVAARFLLHPEMSGLVALSPVLLAALRFGIASLFFILPLARAIRRHELTLRQLALMALLGQMTFSLYYWLQYFGIQQTNASVASILGVGLIPIFSALIAQVLGEERLQFALFVSLLLGFGGVAVIVFQQPFSITLHSGFFFGALCLICNTFFFALYSNLSKRWMQEISPVVMTGGTMICGALGLLLLSFLDPAGNKWSEVPLLDMTQWLALLFLAVGCSVLAYFAYNVALSKWKASRVTVYFYFEPLVTVLLGIGLLGEHLTWQIVTGAAAIGASLLLVNRMRR